MNRREVVVWVLLVVSGVALRFGFEHIPNFAPVAAIALFSGYFLPQSYRRHCRSAGRDAGH